MDKAHVTALESAIKIFGSQAALATELRDAAVALNPDLASVSQQTISYWVTKESLIDPEWWPLFERATKNQVTRVELRPDVFADRLAVG